MRETVFLDGLYNLALLMGFDSMPNDRTQLTFPFSPVYNKPSTNVVLGRFFTETVIVLQGSFEGCFIIH
jgi:hypothetical protein